MPKRRPFEAAASKAARAAQRNRAGRLRDQRVGPNTIRRYLDAALRFCTWLYLHDELPSCSLRELDLQLASCIEALWAEGEGKAVAGYALAGIQHLLLVKRSFPRAWDLYGIWQRMELPRRVPPMLAEVLLGMAGYLVERGLSSIAAALLLGFHCLLRTDEVLSVTSSTANIGPSMTGAVALPFTKTGSRRGAQEIVTIDDPFVGRAVAHELHLRPPGERLVSCAAARFRAAFHEAAGAVGMQAAGLQPYTPRRGGATHDYLAHGDVLRTVARGRWSDFKVAKIYVTDGAAVLAQQRLSPLQRALCERYSAALARAW